MLFLFVINKYCLAKSKAESGGVQFIPTHTPL